MEDNDENRIIVTHYNARKKEWVLPNNDSSLDWCHLPNYLYPSKK